MVAVVVVDFAPEVGPQQYVRVEFRGALHLLPALLDRHVAFAHSLDRLDWYQEMLVADPEVPADRDVQEAHLPIDLVDEEVPHVADKVVVEVGDGAMDEVARHEEDVRPLVRSFHGYPPSVRCVPAPFVPRSREPKRADRISSRADGAGDESDIVA